jgi:hypothetical protein
MCGSLRPMRTKKTRTKKTAKKKTTSTKASFVTTQPADATAKQVVEKAAAEGIKISENYVYRVRASKPRAAKRKNASAPKRAKRSARAGTKTAFVLGLARDLPASEVITRAKAAGFTLSSAHVYAIRSTARSKATGPARGASKRRSAAGSAAPNVQSNEREFVRVAAALGTARAHQLLSRLNAQIQNLRLD